MADCNSQGRPAVRPAKHQHELVTAVARHQVLGSDGRHQDLLGEVAEDCVAGRVTHAIGLSRSGAASLPRAAGIVLTWIAYILAGVALVFYAIP